MAVVVDKPYLNLQLNSQSGLGFTLAYIPVIISCLVFMV